MLKIKQIHADAKKFEVAHPGEDLGYDVFSCETVEILPGEQKLINTGWAAENDSICLMTDQGPLDIKIGLIVAQPSGVAIKKRLCPKAGIIDAGYRNAIMILLYNEGENVQIIYPKDKVAQLIPTLVLTSEIVQVDQLSESSRGLHGWGSGHKTK